MYLTRSDLIALYASPTARNWLIVMCCLSILFNTFFFPSSNRLHTISDVNHYRDGFLLVTDELCFALTWSSRFSSAQFSLLTDWVVWGRHKGRLSRNPLPVFFFSFCRWPLWAVLAWAGMFTLWCCPSSISSANYGVVHPPRCPEGWFWRGCRRMWHVRTMQSFCLLTVARRGSETSRLTGL